MAAALTERAARRKSTSRSQSTSVFILTEAIYSIIAMLFVLLFFRAFVDDSLRREPQFAALPCGEHTLENKRISFSPGAELVSLLFLFFFFLSL